MSSSNIHLNSSRIGGGFGYEQREPISDALQPAVQDRVVSQSVETGQTAAVRTAVNAVMQGFTTPIAHGPRNINVRDKDGVRLTYDFPKLSLADFMSVKNIDGLYHGRGACVIAYEDDEEVGCHALTMLHKFREQSEDDYEDLFKDEKLEITERHALHTKVPKDWITVLDRKLHPKAYEARSKERRAQQMAGMQAAVDAAIQTKIFAKVFIPDPEFRIKRLKHCPEYVACTDIIIFAYKRLPPMKINLHDERTWVRPVAAPPAYTIQPESREYWDEYHRSKLGKVWDAMPSLAFLSRNRKISNEASQGSSRINIEEIPNNKPEEASQKAPDQANGKPNPFFQESGGESVIASRSSSGSCEDAAVCLGDKL